MEILRDTTRALFSGVMMFALVFIGGGLLNGVFWNHITPTSFNEWGVLALATVAGLYTMWDQWYNGPGY